MIQVLIKEVHLDKHLKKDNWEEVGVETKKSLERLLREIHSPSSINDLWPVFQINSVYQDLIGNWSSWTESYRKRRWEALNREMEKTAYATRPYCLRCGDCCRQGSPTLLYGDLPLLRKEIIRRIDLITLRAGEVGFANDTRELVLLEEERIKVKEKPGSRECLVWDSETQSCTIYEDRPIQCRVMECWNPDYFTSLNSQKYLTRKDLLNPDDPLVPVIESHSQRCSVADLQKALSRVKRGFDDAQDDAREILFFDEHLRRHLEKEQGINRENQLFLFGRSISDLIISFGFIIEEDLDGRIKLGYRPGIRKAAADS